jgi:hypothetical protein
MVPINKQSKNSIQSLILTCYCNFCHSHLTSISTFLTTVPIRFICDDGASRFLWNTGTLIPANITAHLTVQKPSTRMLCFWITLQFQIQQNIMCVASRNATPCCPVKMCQYSGGTCHQITQHHSQYSLPWMSHLSTVTAQSSMYSAISYSKRYYQHFWRLPSRTRQRFL